MAERTGIMGIDWEHYEHWSDHFFPTREEREEARRIFDDAIEEALIEIAEKNGFDPLEQEWTEDDYFTFRECMDL